jgi:hypothetical protein
MPDQWFERLNEPSESERLFEPLPLPRRTWVNRDTVRYLVYRAQDDAVMVSANTALEAIRQSGVESPIRVERYIIDRLLEVKEEELSELVEVYVRPVLDRILHESPVVGPKLMGGLLEASGARGSPLGRRLAAPEEEEFSIVDSEDGPSLAPAQAEADPASSEAKAPATPQQAGGNPVPPPSLKSILGEETPVAMPLVAEENLVAAPKP